MDIGAVLHIIGRLCMVMSVLLVTPLVLLVTGPGVETALVDAFVLSAAVSLGLGMALTLSFELRQEAFGVGEAFAVVTASWLVFTALGAMPFVITDAIPSVVDACFEVLSGFTTTGASILDDPAQLSPALLLWRSTTHWVGGMGIVAMSVAILPALGAGGNFLFQAEVPGPESEKLLPRISSTAKVLWAIYVGLTLVEFGALWAVGMTPLDAVCHTFATVATGGFGTRADSLASFGPAVQWIVIVFMFLAGVNFVILLQAVRGRIDRVVRNAELRVYVLIIAGVTLAFMVGLLARGEGLTGLEPLLRDCLFTTVTLLTSTGFVTADYELWPAGLHVLVLLVMFCGACAGSTGGGAKVVRLIVAIKAGMREVRRLLRPRAVFVVKVGQRTLTEELVVKTTGFFVLYLMSLFAGMLLLLLLGNSVATSFSAVLSCLSNIGPGLDAVGPTSNFAALGDLTKLVLMGCMLLGRLEFYCVIVLLVPLAWRR
ncbi:MAG: TrkH family potassium uptake protein [Planctomycetota bacterium]|nr:MAG: TrkH family potassium uptake protein [Planctomycetota bacterium]